jgi:hypothetical protein
MRQMNPESLITRREFIGTPGLTTVLLARARCETNWAQFSKSRVVELRNGRAEVTVSLRRGRFAVSASTDGLPPRFCS